VRSLAGLNDVFTVFSDRREYVRALTAYRNGSRPPLLGPPPELSATARAADLTHEQTPATAPDSVLVLSPAGSQVRDVAQALAAAFGGTHADTGGVREMADTVLRASGSPHVVLLGLVGEVRDGDVVELDDVLWPSVQTGEFGGWVGVVTGADPAQLSWLIAKGLSLHRRSQPRLPHLRVWPAIDNLPVRHGRGPWLLRQDSVEDRVRQLLFAGSVGVASFVAHSRDNAIHLHDTVICAAGPDIVSDGAATDRTLPVCAFTGRCFRTEIEPDAILPARAANVDVVLVNGCTSYRMSEGLVPLRYRLAHGFIAGNAAAYVGTPDLLSGVAKVNELFHIGLDAGLTIGQVTAAVNDHLRYETSDLAHFIAVGVPWLSLGTGRATPAHLAADGLVVLSGREAPGSMLAASVRIAMQTATGERPRHLVYVSPRTERLLDTTVTVSAPGQIADRVAGLRQLGDVVTALESVPLLGFRYSRQANIMVNLRDQVSGLAVTLQRANALSDSGRLRRRIQVVESSVQAAEESLAEALWERGTTSSFRFHEVWGAVMERWQPVAAGRTCPWCGRSLRMLHAEHPLFPWIAREAVSCVQCGLILDRDPRSPVADLRMRCEDFWHRRQEVDVDVDIELQPSHTAPVSAVVGTYPDASVRTRVDCPPPRRVAASPERSTTVRFRIVVTPEAQQHQQTLNVFVVTCGRIVMASRPVWIRPEAASGPPG
jgi:hypothetical protein